VVEGSFLRGFLQIWASKRGVLMVSCGAFVVICMAGRDTKLRSKKVPNLFLVIFYFLCGDYVGGSGLIAPTDQ